MPKLTDKTELTAAADSDLVHIVDISDTTSSAVGTSKKITLTNIFAQFLATARTFASTITSLGVTSGSNASSGIVGEVISSTIAIGSATSLVTNTAKNITTLSLTAGDWLVSGNIGFIAAATTIPTKLIASISATTNTQATSPNGGGFSQLESTLATASTNVLTLPPTRINITTPTTYYLVGTATFTISTLTGYGSITAIRFR
jgi:hypothetical protein